MEPIAIVGIGCRFAGATDAEAYFELLKRGVDATRETPEDRWSVRSFYDPDRRIPGKLATFRGGFLPQVDQFDAQFFGISPREAAYMDPQQRLMLEISWEALEDAGIVPENLAGRDVGVFVGAFTLDYKAVQLGRLNRELIDAHTATGSMMTMVSNRISHLFDFRGPSMSVDTACSSSLVAVHLACQSIRNGECSVALAGGVNVMVNPEYTIAESKGGFLSPDGRCKPFSAAADGYGRAEGAGVVVLKPLAKALADGDPIYAVIRGTAVNQDGHTNGITVPNGEAQVQLILEACRRAGVTPGQIQYVEAHGTGTPVGDPIEAGALGAALGVGRAEGNRCVVGSVKGNIGHLEAAAGVAGLIKATLCLKNGQIPPNLHFEEPNPKIPFGRLPLRVPTTLEQWPSADGPVLAGVNSFGFGGTNAHVVLEEAPRETAPESREAVGSPQPAVLFPISARSPEALEAMARSMCEFARDAASRGISFEDLYYSAAFRRSHHSHRLAAAAGSSHQLAELLEAHLDGECRQGLSCGVRPAGGRPRLVFVCTGMGPQWWAMGRRLFSDEPVFRETILACDEVFRREADWSLLMELMADEPSSRMSETQVAQTANFAIQVALGALWKSWGIRPDAIVGHSVGEVSAAYLSGALGLEDAIRVSFHRSRLQQKTAGSGGMMAAGVPAEEAAELIAPYENRISIAAVNAPASTTLSGDPAALEDLAGQLTARQIFNRPLRVNVAYHSAQMDPLQEELLTSLAGVRPRKATVPLYSTVTGAQVSGAEFDAGYWWQNVRRPVAFRAVMNALIDEGFDCFLEVGPHPVLASSMADCMASRGKKGTTLCSLRRGEDERTTMLGTLGSLYGWGFDVNWDAFRNPSARFVKLPAYPWQRERHWSESSESLADRTGEPPHPLLGQRISGACPAWEGEINSRSQNYLPDHVVQGTPVVPGAAYVEMGIAAAREAFAGADCFVEQLRFERALFLPEAERPKVQLTLDPDNASFQIHSRTKNGEWVRHASGTLRQGQSKAARIADLEAIRLRCSRQMDRESCYEHFRAQGFEYGPAFRKIERIWLAAGEALARFDDLDAEPEYQLHPTVLDGCFQVLVATDPFGSGRAYLPVGIERIRVLRRPQGSMWAWARLEHRNESGAAGSIYLCDDSGTVAVEIENFEVRALDQVGRSLSAEQLDRCLYGVEWKTSPRQAGEERSGRPGSWLVFADRTGAAEQLKSVLEREGETVITVEAGEDYRFSAEAFHCVLDPNDGGQFAHLLEDVRSAASLPLTGVAHLWSLDLASAELDRAESLGCVSVLHLVQALAHSGESPRLWLLTRGVQPAGDHDSGLSLAQAPLWGLGRVIGHQEHLGIWGGLIDLDPAAPADEMERVLQEMQHTDGEDQIAYRGGERYVMRLERCKDVTASLPVRFRTDSAYLITGGLGALGLLTARWMVEHGARRIILMGRTPLPERANWRDVPPGAEMEKRIAAVRELESMGATIVLAPVDVADQGQLSAFLRQYEREGWPPIRGVVHSAGLVRDQLLLAMDTDSFAKVVRPKVRGAWNLHRLLKGTPLDFFVLYSSIGSLVVSTGQGNYAAGNAFLDALAQERRRQGLPAMSINWGPWAVGMVNDLNLAEHYAMRGLDVITPQQGAQMLGRLFAQKIPQVAVVSADWRVLFGFQPKVSPMVAHLGLDTAPSDRNCASVQESEDILLSVAKAQTEEQPALLEAHLTELAARVLRIDRARIDATQPLSMLGMDSMMATELKNRAELTLGVPVSVLELLKGVTIRELAAGLLPRLLDDNAELSRMLEEIEQLPGDAQPALEQGLEA